MQHVRNKFSFGVETLEPVVMFLCEGQQLLHMGLYVGQGEQLVGAHPGQDGVEHVLGWTGVPGVLIPFDNVAQQLVQSCIVQVLNCT